MYLNNFSVRVLGGKELPGGYVELEHGRSYCLVLRNDRPTDCDARVEIDGKAIGTWRIPHNTSTTLERPALDNGRFTFYEAASAEAGLAGLAAGDPNLGLVKVTFTPGLLPRPLTVTYAGPVPKPLAEGLDDVAYAAPVVGPLAKEIDDLPVWAVTNVTAASASETAAISHAGIAHAGSFTSGGTGLSGTSMQVFGTAGPIVPDLTQQTVIHLRLVGRRVGDQPRPLTAYSTPVPPAVR